MAASHTAPPLPEGRRAALEALLSGATPEATADQLGWSAARVVREACAGLQAGEPEHFAGLDDGARTLEIERRLGLPAARGEVASSQPAPPRSAGWAPDPPALHPGVRVEDGAVDGDFCVVSDADRAIYLRLKRPQAAFLAGLDGSRSAGELARDPWALPAELVAPLLARFAQLGLLAGTEPPDSQRRARLRTRDRTRMQVTFADPDRALDRALPLIRALGSPAALVAAGAILAAALVVFSVKADLAALTAGFVGDPVVIAVLVVATLATVMLHELGHAAAVRYHGGHVHRLGVMLFYISPAMFCDTSDAWRFPRRGQRAAVSLAGIGVQLVVTALVVLLMLAPVGASVGAWIALYAFVNFGIAMINLVPFVKLDGYWALVALLDRPNLRADATGLVRERIREVVFGLRRPRRALPAAWAHFAFGLACTAFAPILVLVVAVRYQGWALDVGWIGAACWIVLAGFVLAGPVAGLVAAVRAAAAERRSAAVRGAAVIAAAGAAVLGASMLVSLPLTSSGDFTAGTRPGTATLHLPQRERERVLPGDGAVLTDGSFARSRRLGSAEVVSKPDAGGDVVLRLSGPIGSDTGRAELHGRERPVPLWVLDMYVAPPLRALGL